jgi:hypothetical protein
MLFFLALNPRTDADPDRKGRIEDKAAGEEHAQKRKDEAAQAEWFPDPERGWIRLQEGDRNENAVARNREDNSRLKNKQDRTRWEY